MNVFCFLFVIKMNAEGRGDCILLITIDKKTIALRADFVNTIRINGPIAIMNIARMNDYFIAIFIKKVL